MKHLHIHVTGKVQGVFYRATAREKAIELGLNGTVKNNQDGSVTIEAEGRPDSLEAFLKWCRKGPPAARVESVEATESPLRNMQDFKVIR
jgi:acylphosphatase